MGYMKMHGFDGNPLYDSREWGMAYKFNDILGSTYKWIYSAQKVKNIIKPPLLPVFISSVFQFDKFFHPVVLGEIWVNL